MSNTVEVKVPDIGDFENVGVIEVLVTPGDRVEKETSLITLESDKATMEIPSPEAGRVEAVHVAVGDTVSRGSPILTLVTGEDAAATTGGRGGASPKPAPEEEPVMRPPQVLPRAARGKTDMETEVLVLGAGPGGYTAAFRAADLGKRVTLVERYPTLGGVCLNVGCIPSKALLHMAKVVSEAREMAAHGAQFGAPQFDLDKLRAWKEGVVGRLTSGLAQLAKQRRVQVVQGVGRFESDHRLAVETEDGTRRIAFEHAIIAAGSQPVSLPGLPADPRIMDSTGALMLADVPERLLVIGGGIIGLEMATVYDALGSKVTVVELTPELIPGCDRDLVRPLQKRIQQRYENILLETKVVGVEALDVGLRVSFEGKKSSDQDTFDRILVAVGRRPNGHQIGAEAAGVRVTERGFIPVDDQQRTNVPHIFAIGDIVGQPQLAHKATHEGKVAAEVIAGRKVGFAALAIPSVAYTDPEVAWMGLTEREAKDKGIAVDKAVFPWAASGRSLGMGRDEGMTKLLLDKDTGRVVGAGIVGAHAGDLISETMLALEMGADAEDIALTIHPHPTLSETVAFAAEMAEGTITDLLPPKRKK